jgi:hypothetical protein
VASFTQLPDNLDARIPELARQLAKGSQSALETAQRMSDHLQTQFGYTLDLGAGGGEDPLAAFLFARRSGHCELFASALTVMLRSLEIPARVVNGFVASERNGTGDYYLVRARDAHAWVEVLVEPSRWAVFDPTPAEPAVSGPWWAPQRLAMTLEAVRLSWDRWVVSFSRDDQRELKIRGTRLGHALAAGLERTMRSLASASGPTWLGFLTAGIALGFGLIGWRLAGRRRRRASLEQPAVSAYRRMLVLLRRNGRAKPASQTPLEYAAQIGPEAPEVEQITVIYAAARYAARSASPGQQQRLKQLLASLGQRLKGRPIDGSAA